MFWLKTLSCLCFVTLRCLNSGALEKIKSKEFEASDTIGKVWNGRVFDHWRGSGKVVFCHVTLDDTRVPAHKMKAKNIEKLVTITCDCAMTKGRVVCPGGHTRDWCWCRLPMLPAPATQAGGRAVMGRKEKAGGDENVSCCPSPNQTNFSTHFPINNIYKSIVGKSASTFEKENATW